MQSLRQTIPRRRRRSNFRPFKHRVAIARERTLRLRVLVTRTSYRDLSEFSFPKGTVLLELYAFEFTFILRA